MHESRSRRGAQPHDGLGVQEVRLDDVDRARSVQTRVAQGGEVHDHVGIADVGLENLRPIAKIAVPEEESLIADQMRGADAFAVPTRHAESSIAQQRVHQMRSDESVGSEDDDVGGRWLRA